MTPTERSGGAFGDRPTGETRAPTPTPFAEEPQVPTPITADVSAQRVAQVYAEALLNTAEKHGQAEEIAEELESLVQDLFAREPQLEAFLASGAIGRHRKAEALGKIFAPRASPLFLNFLLVLNAHERLGLLRPILRAYKTLRDERLRRIRVQVRTAVPLADEQQERLRRELREVFDLEPLLETRVEPALLGGLVVRIGDWLYDASVRTRIENIRNQIIARSSHEIQSRRDHFSTADGD